MDSQKLKDFFLHDEFARTSGIQLIEVCEGYARTQVTIPERKQGLHASYYR